jgi:CubicO group peptidase (beta-lactamase class C family)
MEVGIDFTEIYDDQHSDITKFAYAAGMRDAPEGATAYSGLYDYLPTLRKKGEHGVDFHYVTANSEVLGWIVEHATSTPIAQLLGERIYEHIGAERDAFYITDPLGKAVAGGGMCVTAPDLLRLALLVAHDGMWNGKRLVPEAVIARLKAGGTPRPSLWGNESGGTDCSYTSQWYIHHPGRVLHAAGIHGQNIFMSTEHDSVMVLQSSQPEADGDFFAVAASYFAAVTDHLAGS